jgi:hypothetical protein
LNTIEALDQSAASQLVRRLRSTPKSVPFWETPEQALAAACRLPLDLKRFGHASPVQLIEASGYAEHRARIDEHAIAGVLSRSSELLEAWQAYSEDQRCSPSWYLRSARDAGASEPGRAVGWMPREGPKPPEELFATWVAATAVFVKRMLEGFAQHSVA